MWLVVNLRKILKPTHKWQLVNKYKNTDTIVTASYAYFCTKINPFFNMKIRFFILKGFWTIVFIFIVISTMFQLICSPAFSRCLSNSGTYMELRTTSFIESMGVACSDSVSHNRVQVLNIPVLLLAYRTHSIMVIGVCCLSF